MIAANRTKPKDFLQKTSLIIKPRKVVFYVIFVLTFLLSGLITSLHLIPYRMGLVSLLIIPLLLFYGIKIDRVFIAYVVLAVLIGLSAVFNQSSMLEFILFLRTLGFSFLIYYLTELYITKKTITKVVRFCVFIAVIQLPIIIFQQSFYTQLPAHFTQGVSHTDFDFGTFNFKGDSSMALFLALVVIFLLFDIKRNHIIRYRWPIAFWLTLTVLVVNSEVGKIIIAIVWVIYIVRYLNIKVLLSSFILISLIIGVLAMTGVLDQIWNDFSRSFSSNISMGQLREEAFLSGSYSRGAAVAYYLNQPLKWFGDGPSKYYNVLSNTRTVGNTGHIFTFYSEVGLLAMLTSFLIFSLIAFSGEGWYVRFRWVGILSFISIILLSFTTEVMNDISIVLIYAIIAKTYLIPPLKQIELQHTHL